MYLSVFITATAWLEVGGGLEEEAGLEEEMGLLLRRWNKSSEGCKWPYLFSIIFSMFVCIWDMRAKTF